MTVTFGTVASANAYRSLAPCTMLPPCSFFFSSRRRHTRCLSDWSSDVCSSDLLDAALSSPTGRGVIADDEGRLVGAVRASSVLALIDAAGNGANGNGRHGRHGNERDRKSVV